MKPTKRLMFRQNALDKIVAGINKVADAVESTLGPNGQIVMIEGNGYQSNLVTKDGVTVAKSIFLEDPYEDLGAAILKDASLRANEHAGDGTTTTVVVARAMINSAVEHLKNGVDREVLCRDLESAAAEAEKYIKEKLVRHITEEKDFYSVAHTSANGDKEVADIVSGAFTKVGENGVVLVEESPKQETTLKVYDGFNVSYGFATPHFITAADKAVAVLDNPIIVIFKGKLQDLMPVMNLLEDANNKGQSVVLVAESFSADVLGILVLNKQQNGLRICAVTHDTDEDTLKDMAIKCGCMVVPEGLRPLVTSDHLGRAARVRVGKSNMTIVDAESNKEDLESLRLWLQDAIDTAETPEDKAALRERLARLIGGVAVISVGGPTLAYMKERKDRIDDAVCAVTSARENGVVPGGGKALAHVVNVMCPDNLSPFAQGLKRPYITLNKTNYDVVLPADKWEGYDIRTGQRGDLFDMGVIDPAMAAILAVRHAVAVTVIALRTGCLIINTPREEEPTPETVTVDV